MSKPCLPERELELMRQVFRRHPAVQRVKLFGSRAKGIATAGSDVDFAVWGPVSRLDAQSIALDLDDLPLPYLYDVLPFETIEAPALREHIQRVGITVYSSETPSLSSAE